MEEYLTVLVAAEYLGVSRDKISRMIRSGQITAIPDPVDTRQKLIARSQLDALRPSGKVIRAVTELQDIPAADLRARVERARASGEYVTEQESEAATDKLIKDHREQASA